MLIIIKHEFSNYIFSITLWIKILFFKIIIEFSTKPSRNHMSDTGDPDLGRDLWLVTTGLQIKHKNIKFAG
jgi:hypothetical protein